MGKQEQDKYFFRAGESDEECENPYGDWKWLQFSEKKFVIPLGDWEQEKYFVLGAVARYFEKELGDKYSDNALVKSLNGQLNVADTLKSTSVEIQAPKSKEM